MGHPDRPVTPTSLRVDRRTSSRADPYVPDEELNNALGSIRVLGSIELIEHELRPHMNTVLSIIQEKRKGAPEQVVLSGILPILALPLRRRGPLTLLSARLVAELAREPVVCKGFGDSGLVPALTSVLTSTDQELLLHAATAISRMSYESSIQQGELLRLGAVPRLIGVLLRFPANAALEGACLTALCNLGDMGEADHQGAGLLWQRGVAPRPQELVFRGVSPPGGVARGSGSSVTMVRLSQFAPGQYAASVEAFQRCPSSLWKLHANRQATGGPSFVPFLTSSSSSSSCGAGGPGAGRGGGGGGGGGGSSGWGSLVKVMGFSTCRSEKTPHRSQSFRTRVFHTLI